MLVTLSEVVRNIVVLIILITVLDLVLPRSDFKPFVNMVVGLVLMLMLLSPLRSLLNLPGVLDPVWEMQLSVSQSDIDARQALLEQMNWELTLARFRDLVSEKISSVLAEHGLEVMELTLLLEEDTNHLEFGQPQQIKVLAQPGQPVQGDIERVEKVRIDLGGNTAAVPESVRASRIEQRLGDILGVTAEKIEVWVLKHQ